MFGLGWSEMMVVGIVALIVIGPKDLPGLFRTMGEFTGKAKGMAREFSRAMNAAADDAGVSEISKTLKAASNPGKYGSDKIKEAAAGMLPGGETEKLSKERAEAKKKILAQTAKAARERKEREAEAEATAAPEVPAEIIVEAPSETPAKEGDT